MQPQLYDLNNDLGEKHNLAAERADVLKELAASLKRIRDDGRSRP